MLTLERPLVAIDLEATSTDPESARIIQAAWKRFEPQESGVAENEALSRSVVVNPGIPVDPDILELTGITQDQLDNGVHWFDAADDLANVISDADLLGYNIVGYDYPLLGAEYERINRGVPGPEDRVLVDAYALERELNPMTLENVYGSYTGKTLEDAHDAAADVRATWEVLMSQCAVYDLKGSSPEDLQGVQRGDFLDAGKKLKRLDDGSVQVCFGKHSGKTVSQVLQEDRDYLRWVYGEITELQTHLDEILKDQALA